MAIAFVQKQTGGGSAIDTFPLTFGTDVGAGNFLAACYSPFSGPPPNNAPTGGGTWNTTTAPNPQNGANAYINYAMDATGGATTVTVDYGTGFYISGSIAEFSGVLTSGALDVQAEADSAADSTPTVGPTGTTVQADELVLVCLSISEADVSVGIDVPATTGYTNLHVEQDALNIMGHSSDYKIVSSTGTQDAAWGTLDGAYAWSAKIATFKADLGNGPAARLSNQRIRPRAFAPGVAR
jgi:hypothetical protein